MLLTRNFLIIGACLSAVGCVDTSRPTRPPSTPADSGLTNPPPPPPGRDAEAPLEDSGTNSMHDAGMMMTGMDAEPPPPPPDSGPARTGLAVLGWNSHDLAAVNVEVLSSPSDGLNVPRDLAFNPQHPGELWVVNRADDSTVTYFDVGTPSQRAEKRIDPYAEHFMEEVSSIAFGAPGKFGTCQESRNTYNRARPPDDFMGPSLWPSDMAIYGRSNPEAVIAVGFDLGSHLDMLHESPYCMGIAWESANVYWTFDGMEGSISRYDFQMDHGPGFDDHSDGIIQVFARGQFTRVADVPSHLERDPASGLLYIADTGAARIAVLDASNMSSVRTLPAKEPGTTFYAMTGETVSTLAEGSNAGLVHPSGLVLAGGMLFVTDNANSRITAFDLSGNRLDWLDTGFPAGSLMGVTADAEGRLYLVDAVADRVLRISAKAD